MGVFITFEGGEGSGKSTQIRRLAASLRTHHQAVLLTREPGGTTISEHIRSIIADKIGSRFMQPETELLLFAACRAQLVREIIEPALQQRKFVLCDRFYDSTIVYQGIARQLRLETVQLINQFAMKNCQPDITFLLDIPSKEGKQRVFQRKQLNHSGLDRIESEDFAFHDAVREGYRYLAQQHPDRIVLIDGLQPIPFISKQIFNIVQSKFLS